jgi:hypothetical protein
MKRRTPVTFTVVSLAVAVILTLNCSQAPRRASAGPTCCEVPENDACRGSSSLTPAAIAELVKELHRGNRRSIDIAFASRQYLDGGELEDLDRELATLAGEFPLEFLEAARMHCLDDRQLKKLVTMLPLESVDDVPRRKAFLNERITRLAAVDNQELQWGRDRAVSALRDSLKALEGLDHQ